MNEKENEFERKEERRQEFKENYAREKLWEAIRCLINEGPLIDRINESNYFVMRLTPEHFPDELVPKFLIVRENAKRAHCEAHGSASGDLMSSEELRETAESILALYVSLKGGITAKGP